LNAEFLSEVELRAMRFSHLGAGVLIHPTCVFVGCREISIGDHVRIDPFTVVTANEPMTIGAYTHVGGHCLLSGSYGITIGDFCSVSPGARIFSASDDFAAAGLVGPQIPDEFRVVKCARVTMERFSCVGANAVVLPGSRVGEGTTIGALSLVRGDLLPWGVYAGVPAKRKAERDRDAVLKTAARFAADRAK
jgi:galactoside O-acetyltransferase